MLRGQARVRSGRGFTLIELLVVVSIIALLISILLPSLSRARKQTQLIKCTSNLKSMANGIMIYSSETGGILPGPLHPAMYRDLKAAYPDSMAKDTRNFWRGRMLTWKLQSTFKDKGSGGKGNISDQVATCPVLLGTVPDSHFTAFAQATGKGVQPTHYVINTYGTGGVENNGSPMGAVVRTAPEYYFGMSYPGASDSDRPKDKPPKELGSIKNASAEWAVAEAWYRPRMNTGMPRLQQEGPYQSGWSGEAFPNFAPHMRRGSSGYSFTNSAARISQDGTIRKMKGDGITTTCYFDGHAGGVRSKSIVLGTVELFYGFPGTRNGGDALPATVKLPNME